ncbi:hypothetical protein [Winogradskyella vidalii]|uniref:hypothetical protein n=1 Tax=Winogradskyella vidalii TaxID=2615024 RepID=UPI0015C6D8DD|nr:hypothetical protein [Winogradskyella vidalii]
MKKAAVIIGLASAIIATILSVTKFSNQAVIPIIIAFTSGLAILFLSNKAETKPKPIQYIFLLVIISLSLTIYKGVLKTPEIEATDQQEQNIKDSDDSDTINNTVEKY